MKKSVGCIMPRHVPWKARWYLFVVAQYVAAATAVVVPDSALVLVSCFSYMNNYVCSLILYIMHTGAQYNDRRKVGQTSSKSRIGRVGSARGKFLTR